MQKAVSRRALNRQENSRGTKPIRTKYTATHLQTSIFSSGNCKKKTEERRCSHLCNLRYLFYCFATTKTAHDNNKRTSSSSSSSSSAAAATPACCRIYLPHENLSFFLVVFWPTPNKAENTASCEFLALNNNTRTTLQLLCLLLTHSLMFAAHLGCCHCWLLSSFPFFFLSLFYFSPLLLPFSLSLSLSLGFRSTLNSWTKKQHKRTKQRPSNGGSSNNKSRQRERKKETATQNRTRERHERERKTNLREREREREAWDGQ